MVEDERDPVGARLAAAAAVDAAAHELRDDGHGHREEDEAEHGDAPRVLVVQHQFDAGRDVCFNEEERKSGISTLVLDEATQICRIFGYYGYILSHMGHKRQ